MKDEFLAVVKLVSGEEIYSLVSPYVENDEKYLILHNPVKITKVNLNQDVYTYKVEPWIKLSSEDLFLLKESSIITVIESFDREMIFVYKRYLNSSSQSISGNYTLNKSEGYINNVKDFRETLEKIYKSNKIN